MRPSGRSTHRIVGVATLLFAVVIGLLGAALSIAIRLPGFGSAGPRWQALAVAHPAILLVFSAIPAMLGGFGTLFLPTQIGAADTAFPRLGLASLLLVGLGFASTTLGLLLPAPSWLLAATNLTAIGLCIGAANLAATILNERADGVEPGDLGLFAWSELVACALLLCIVPVFAAGLSIALLRHQPVLTPLRPLFAPLLCVALLPGLGLALEIVSSLSGRPMPGRRSLVAAMATMASAVFMIGAKGVLDRAPMPDIAVVSLIGLLMLAGLGCCAATIGSAKGLRRCANPPGLFALGFLSLSIGSTVSLLSGSDALHDGLSLSLTFALFAAFYWWAGSLTGRMVPSRLGVAQFWLLLAGVLVMLLPIPAAQALGSAAITLSLLLFAGVLVGMATSRRAMPATLQWARS